jgi:hypothetical protein
MILKNLISLLKSLDVNAEVNDFYLTLDNQTISIRDVDQTLKNDTKEYHRVKVEGHIK